MSMRNVSVAFHSEDEVLWDAPPPASDCAEPGVKVEGGVDFNEVIEFSIRF